MTFALTLRTRSERILGSDILVPREQHEFPPGSHLGLQRAFEFIVFLPTALDLDDRVLEPLKHAHR